MNEETETGWSVLLSSPDSLKAPEIGAVLGKWRKMPFQDAVRMARNCWGVVMEGLAEPEAQALSLGLEQAALPAFVLGPGLLAGLPDAKPVKKLDMGDPSLVRLTLLAAAGFTVTESHVEKTKVGPSAAQRAMNMGVMMATGLPIKLGKQERVVERTVEDSDLRFFVDLIFGEPFERLRIDAQAFDYSCLGARKQYNVLMNLKTLLADLSGRAPAAWKNKGTGILLANRPVREMGYRSLEDLDRESRWLLTLLRRSTP